MNIAAANAANYVADAAGLRASSGTLSRKMRGIRRCYQGTASVEEAQDAKATLSDLLAEEEGKEQG